MGTSGSARCLIAIVFLNARFNYSLCTIIKWTSRRGRPVAAPRIKSAESARFMGPNSTKICLKFHVGQNTQCQG
ncbi:hypothetical protein F4809DRAFT_457235 [Biscogniauxia mediterranea]|nr:hypothetical protein F4809DRAFT_457235 [Biscogniauxia mediterranea]